jgi:hypothetical protein
VQASHSALVGFGISLLLLSLPAPAIGAGQTAAEDVPVRGGIAALAEAASLAPAPDRARAVAELARAVYSWPQTGPYSNEAVRRRIAAFFADASSPATIDTVPIPLSAAVWNQSVLRHRVSTDVLVGAILADRSAALLCYGLAGMDDETVRFFGDHSQLLGRLAGHAPGAFAAFGESLRIRGGRVVPRGGDAAAAAWEAVVGEKLDRPERFAPALFESDRGRLAYLYDVLAHVDAPMLAELVDGGRQDRTAPLKRLASLARHAFPEWEVATAPFVRPQAELAAFFARLSNASAADAGATSMGSSFWRRIFDDAGSSGAASAARAAETPADSITLAEMILSQPSRERERRLDLLSFAMRAFAGRPADDGDVALAVRGFGSFPVLMLTLERMGIRTPAIYATAARQAERLTALDSSRGHVALAQFQGSLALIARLAAVGTVNTPTAERLVRDLLAVTLSGDGRYDGAMAAWIRAGLRPALPAGASDDDRLLAAAAGAPSTAPGRRIEWEGQRYRIDPGGAELQRLKRARARQEETSVDTLLDLAELAQAMMRSTFTLDDARDAAAKLTAASTQIAAVERADAGILRTLREAAQTVGKIRRPGDLSDARHAASQLVPAVDEMLGAALLSLAYAFDLGDPEGTILIAGDPSRRHDFGYALPGRDARVKSMWSVASVETRGGPWHLVGSALALDVAMAQLALRRISIDRVPESPMLNLMQRDGFAASVAVMNPLALTDADRDAIAERIERGTARMRAAVSRRDPVGHVENVENVENVEALAAEIGMDGWRTRALRWTIAHEPERAPSLFSMVELLVLGGGSPAAFNSWGVYSLRTAGCLCARLPDPVEWRRWFGLSQAGLPATLVADLPLRVAVVLHNLQLPAVLAKSVLASAMQDFVDGINPSDGNDWLSLARGAQAIGPERFEDYIAAATADGPLLPDEAGRPGER